MKTYFTFMKESHTPYPLYHKSYTDAINAALAHHKDKEGLNVSDEDRDTHIAMGPRKPAEGETVEHHIPATDKNGKRRIIHIQVYNKGGLTPYELNAYSSGDKIAEGLASTLGNVAKRALNVAKPVAIGAAKLTVKKVVKPIAKRVFNGVMQSISEDPTEYSLGNHTELIKYAKTLGPKHIDYHDLMTAASHMAFGNMDHLKKHLNAMDTDVRDKIKEYMKEEAEQIDELSKKKIGDYSQLASAEIVGNQPVGDKLRKRNNREKFIKLAYNKYYGYKTKVPATNEEVELDEQVSFKKTISGHHIHHNGERVGEIIKTNSMGSLGYSVRFRGKEVSSERSLDAAKESAKYHLTSLKEQEELDEISIGSTAITYHDHIGAKEMTPAEIKAKHKSYLDTEAHHRERSKDPNLTSNQRMASGAVASAAKIAAYEWEHKYMKDEVHSHRKVDDLKSKGKHHEAGVLAAKSSHLRQYGAHFGMRSGKKEAQRQFFKGYDSVNQIEKIS